jgi:hypothetical protein
MVLNRIRNSRFFKGIALYLVFNILSQVVAPSMSFALTGGPAQPEFGSFTPIGTSDMVDLSSGDFSYNIPLLDVGGYPLNLAYSSNITMDEEASWVGLGWNLSVGQINRNVRGIPDDFDGDEINYQDNIKANLTIGASANFKTGIFGKDIKVPPLPNPAGITNIITSSTESNSDSNSSDGTNPESGPGPESESESDSESGGVKADFGLAITYNTYSGYSVTPSFGMGISLGEAASVGFSVQSNSDGLSISPNLSLTAITKSKSNRLNGLEGTIGAAYNSRKGLSSLTLNTSKRAEESEKAQGRTSGIKIMSNVGSTISFTNTSYTPSKRIKMLTESISVNGKLGTTIFGAEGDLSFTAYGTIQHIAKSEKNKNVRAYGYCNTNNARYERNSVLDFNREKDGNVSKNTTNLPLTNYTYDIYAVQGQGVSGMYRPFRNQVGYLWDSEVKDLSLSATLGLEFGIGNAARTGVDVEGTVAIGRSGEWWMSNPARQSFVERLGGNKPDYERVVFKNVGDLSVDNELNLLTHNLGDYKPIRIRVSGARFNRVTEKVYQAKTTIMLPNINTEFVGYQLINHATYTKREDRKLRNQSILNITIGELKNGVGEGPVAKNPNLVPDTDKDHHTGEVQITRTDGARYIYGLPAFNTTKKETTFAVRSESGDCSSGLVPYTPGVDNSVNNNHGDHFFNQITTPGYAHTYLLTSVLSTDYQDLTNNGPSTDDLGSYTKFTYEKTSSNYKWRVPYEENMASYNEGLRSDLGDDQGNYTYGEKELYFVKRIETKTHVAIFLYTDRKDALGVKGQNGGRDNNAVTKKLSKIKLYALPEFEKDGEAATPIKTVHFGYSYDLCQGVPNNDNSQTPGEAPNNGGKLTLNRVYFTYRNSEMGRYSGYTFDYGNLDDENTNPRYNLKSYDIWGNYKPNIGVCNVVGSPTAPEFNYVEQDNPLTHKWASAWSLRKIELPSGGSINVEYEADDYQYVQDKVAHRMYKVVGVGKEIINEDSFDSSTETDWLYTFDVFNKHTNFLYVEVDRDAFDNPTKFYDKQVLNLEKKLIHFRFFVNMTSIGSVTPVGWGATPEESLNDIKAKFEYVSGYCELDESKIENTIMNIDGKYYASIPVKTVNREGGLGGLLDVNPIAKAAWHFGRKYLSQHVYNTNPNGASESDLENLVSDLLSPGILNNLLEIFQGANGRLQSSHIAQRFVKDKSWIRLVEPSGKKLGGGCRVQDVRMSDIWQEMNDNNSNYETMHYGQEYTYTLKDGHSSGVASYEPIGSKENPFVQPVFSTTRHLLAPNEENYVEKPFGESFFPSPVVTYSRVTVQNLQAGTRKPEGHQLKVLHKTGYVESLFYTTKDYPTIVDQTELWLKEDKSNLLRNLLKLSVKKHLTATQGYVIHLNDMNGKEKGQWVYAEGQSDPISGVEYKYHSKVAESDNKGTLDNNLTVIYPDGSIHQRIMGVEYDVINDFRENSTNSTTIGVNGNVNGFFAAIFPAIIPSFFPDFSFYEDQFRSSVTTKIIQTYGILKETIAHDAGATISTTNLAYDALTGEVLLTEVQDEYGDHYYTFNYPAHWHYDGMGMASRNSGFTNEISHFTGNLFRLSDIPNYTSSDFLINGDEVTLTNNGAVSKAWVVEVSSNTFKLMDRNGVLLGSDFNNATLKVIRSGRRNLQSAGVSSITLMHNPLINFMGENIENIESSFMMSNATNNWKIINAGAVEYAENWAGQCECGLGEADGVYNPYLRNEKGIWRTIASHTYLAGRKQSANPTPRVEGYFSHFSPYYRCENGAWIQNNAGWTNVSEVSMYSPYGFELENKDALDRYSAAQYGYNHTFPMAVGANTRYSELGFDGFEDYNFDGCTENKHFGFAVVVHSSNETPTEPIISNKTSHSGRYSLFVPAGQKIGMSKQINCNPTQGTGGGTAQP